MFLRKYIHNYDTLLLSPPSGVTGISDLSKQWHFDISGVKYDISRVTISGNKWMQDGQYITLDVSCIIYGREASDSTIKGIVDACNNAFIYKTDICQNNYEMNIRNKKGNYNKTNHRHHF